jgi:UDP-glucose:(glucosyl)LPS alpha-1,2-glucosyltransferase
VGCRNEKNIGAIMSNDPSSFFSYNENCFGGTEYMAKNFQNRVFPYLSNIKKYRCFVFPGKINSMSEAYDDVPNILWIHNLIYQFDQNTQKFLKSEKFLSTVKYIVAVSEFQKNKISEELNFDKNKIVVIQNATESIDYNKNKFNNFDKVKIIYASSPDRGLEVLLNSIKYVKKDFELNVFNDFYPDIYKDDYSLNLINDERVNFYGKTPRKTLYKYFANSHIHAYPSIYEETSCLTQIESLISGCLSVYTNFGALQETSLGNGIMCNFSNEDIFESSKIFADGMSNAIDLVESKKFNPEKQAKDVSNFYSWENFLNNWIKFDKAML